MIIKRISIFILLFVVITSSGAAVFSEGPGSAAFSGNPGTDPYIRAEQLSQLGLLKGVGKGDYDLQRSPTRAESVVMMLRLIGKEKEALRYQGDGSPFNDVPSWAGKYVSYAYKNGLIKGVSYDKFGSAMMIDANQYLTILLRALGYSDDGDDFTYADPKSLAAGIGLLDGWDGDGKFLRADMIFLSFNALKTRVKGSQAPLYQHMAKSGVFSLPEWEKACALEDIAAVQRNNFEWKNTVTVTIANMGEFSGAIKSALVKMPEEIAVYTPAGFYTKHKDDMEEAFSAFFGYTKKTNLKTYAQQNYIVFKPEYTSGFMSLAYLRNPTVPVEDDIKALALKGFYLFRDEVGYRDSSYELVKAIHDFIAEYLEYDLKKKPGSGELDGALNERKATCGGYAAMFNYFAAIAGIESETVHGTVKNPGGDIEKHAWNIVKIDGAWYHIDVTWDDPVTNTGENVIKYKYFLAGDGDMSKDHTWNKALYPKAPGSWK